MELYEQPIVDTVDGSIIAHELLVRLRNVDGSVIAVETSVEIEISAGI